MKSNQLIYSTLNTEKVRTLAYTVTGNALNLRQIEGVKAYTECTFECTQNVRLDLMYNSECQSVKKMNVRKCTGQKQTKKADSSEWSGISGSLSEAYSVHVQNAGICGHKGAKTLKENNQ
jgi:hypothetical protein